jgi:hypothetical protein
MSTDASDPDSFLNQYHVPEDAGEHAEDLRKLLERIPLRWGRWISCGPGWYPFIIELDRKLAEIAPDYELHQVKEKFGTLRYYIGFPYTDSEDHQRRQEQSEQMEKIIREYEEISAITCESCGNPGKTLARHHWYRTLCPTCGQEQGYLPVPEDSE